MNEKKFWEIIERSLDSEEPYESIFSQLSEINREDILSFHYILTQKLAEACVFPVLAANFVISSYVSDDGFKEFRAWLIGQGMLKFNKAIVDPETITDWLDKDDVDKIEGEQMLSVAQDVYEEVYEDDFLDKVKFEREPELVQEWPDNKAEYRNKWPRLVDKFWNQERIREMHAG